MSHDIRLTQVKVTPIAFRDCPLRNAAGIHEPWALRAIIELETSDGRVGISETYGDEPMLRALALAQAFLVGLSPFDLNEMEVRVGIAVKPTPGGSEFELAPGSHASKNTAKVVSAFEVAMLDLQGQILGAPVVDLLGGRVRSEVPYSAYLFFKYAEHIGKPYAPDAWGEAITPEEIVEQAHRMIDLYGFQSIKLKGGVFEPSHEINCMKALAKAFPDRPLRLDPNANWTLETSIKAIAELDGILEYYEDPCPARSRQHGRTAAAYDLTARNQYGDHHNGRLPPQWREGRGQGPAVRSSLLGWPAGHIDAGAYVPGVGPGRINALQFASWYQSDRDDARRSEHPNLTYACDTHYPWQEDDIIKGGRVRFDRGAVRVPTTPGLGVELDYDRLAELHDQYLLCDLRYRDDLKQMRKYDPDFSGKSPRF
ncbi:enolase C-terminal domain-like protein [Candidatus Burkholderia verschuerenii]|uniref:enolase C-terminal domain-like protein n=1 Tax=Candidatus Burkholderia verschuerenii TaxID=242163 RepID=UPI000A65E710